MLLVNVPTAPPGMTAAAPSTPAPVVGATGAAGAAAAGVGRVLETCAGTAGVGAVLSTDMATSGFEVVLSTGTGVGGAGLGPYRAANKCGFAMLLVVSARVLEVEVGHQALIHENEIETRESGFDVVVWCGVVWCQHRVVLAEMVRKERGR